MIDYHIHPDFSQDAEGSIVDYCGRAMELGFEEVCFTTHYEPDPARRAYEFVRVLGVEQPVDSDWATHYFREIGRARDRYPRLTVLAGIEVGYELGLEGTISDFLSSHPFDFVLGAVHCLDHVAITSGNELDRFRREYLPKGAESIAERYCHYLRAAAGSGLFDCLAHLDIYRKYILQLCGEPFWRRIEALLPATLQSIARSGTGLEVNSSGLRRGDSEPYPASDIVRMARDAGVSVFTTGSDAHRAEDLGRDVDRAAALLSGFGIRPARFRGRRRVD